jgi:hypothetical protein
MIRYNHIEIFPKEVCDIKLGPRWFFKFLKNKRIGFKRFFEIFIFKYLDLIVMKKTTTHPTLVMTTIMLIWLHIDTMWQNYTF